MKIKTMLLSALSVLAVSATALGVGTWKTLSAVAASADTVNYTYEDDFSSANTSAWTLTSGSDGSTAKIENGKMTLTNLSSAARLLATLEIPYKSYELTFTLSDNVCTHGGTTGGSDGYRGATWVMLGDGWGSCLPSYYSADGVIPDGVDLSGAKGITNCLYNKDTTVYGHSGSKLYFPTNGAVKFKVEWSDAQSAYLMTPYYWNTTSGWTTHPNWSTPFLNQNVMNSSQSVGNTIGFGFIGATGSYSIDDLTVTSLDAEDDTIVENDTLSYDSLSSESLAVTAKAGATVAAVTVAGKPVAATFASNVATISAETLAALDVGDVELGVHLSDGSYEILTLNVTRSKKIADFTDDFSTDDGAWTLTSGSDGLNATIADGKMTLTNTSKAYGPLATLNVPYKNYELTFTLSDNVCTGGGTTANNGYNGCAWVMLGDGWGCTLPSYYSADGVIPDGTDLTGAKGINNCLFDYRNNTYSYSSQTMNIQTDGKMKFKVEWSDEQSAYLMSVYNWDANANSWTQHPCWGWVNTVPKVNSSQAVGNTIGFGFISASGRYTIDDLTITSLDVADDGIVTEEALSYDIASADDLAVTAKAGATAAAVTVAGRPIASTFEGNVATIGAETLAALGEGEKELGVHLSDGSYDILTLTVENKYMEKLSALNLQMQKGAAIRIGTYEYTGIRFTTDVNEDAYNALMKIVGDDKTFKKIEFGTVIVPVDYVGENACGELTAENVFGETPTYTEFINAPYEWTEDGFGFFGGIKDLKTENVARGFVGVGYVKYTLADGEEGYQFAEFFGNDMANNTRSVYEVAVMAYEDTAPDAPTAQEKENIKGYYIDIVKEFEVEYYTVDGTVATLQDSVTRFGVIGKEVFGALRKYEGYTYDADYEGGIESAVLEEGTELVLKYYFVKEGA